MRAALQGSLAALVATAIVELAGVSHWLHLDDPDGFARALDAFLATLPTTGPPR